MTPIPRRSRNQRDKFADAPAGAYDDPGLKMLLRRKLPSEPPHAAYDDSSLAKPQLGPVPGPEVDRARDEQEV